MGDWSGGVRRQAAGYGRRRRWALAAAVSGDGALSRASHVSERHWICAQCIQLRLRARFLRLQPCGLTSAEEKQTPICGAIYRLVAASSPENLPTVRSVPSALLGAPRPEAERTAFAELTKACQDLQSIRIAQMHHWRRRKGLCSRVHRCAAKRQEQKARACGSLGSYKARPNVFF